VVTPVPSLALSSLMLSIEKRQGYAKPPRSFELHFELVSQLSNSKGRTILDELDTMKAAIARLESEDWTRESEIKSHRAETLNLTHEVDRLKLALDGYTMIRKRFPVCVRSR